MNIYMSIWLLIWWRRYLSVDLLRACGCLFGRLWSDVMAAQQFMEEIALLKRLAGSKTVVEIVDSEILDDMILVVCAG